MKKILSLLLVFVLVFSVVACKKTEGDAQTGELQTVIAETKEGAVANAFGINQADIKKSEGSAEIKLELKEGFMSLVPDIPFEDKEGLEKLLITVVGKMGIKVTSTSNADKGLQLSTGFNLNYDGKELATMNIKLTDDKYYYYIPQILDKTLVVSAADLAKSSEADADMDPEEQERTMRAMNAIM